MVPNTIEASGKNISRIGINWLFSENVTWYPVQTILFYIVWQLRKFECTRMHMNTSLLPEASEDTGKHTGPQLATRKEPLE